MVADVAITINDDDITPALRKLIGQVNDTRPMMGAISQTLLDSIEEALENEADPETGTPWPALAPATILQRTRKGKWPGKMLQVSQGGLASSFGASFGERFALAGSNKPYARIHHLGGKTGRNHATTIPPRPYAGLTPEHRHELQLIVRRHLSI